MLSGDPLHYIFGVIPPEGEKTLSVLTLSEREKIPCVQSPPEGKKTVCTALTGGGKTLCVQSPPEGEKKLCTGYIQSSSVQQCTRKVTKSDSGGQTETVPSRMGKTRLLPVNYRAHKRRI